MSANTIYALRMFTGQVETSIRIVDNLISSGAASKTTWEGSLQNTFKIYTVLS